MKKILIIIDGLGDVKYRELGNKSPLEYAKTPNLDYMARNGITGVMQPIKNIAPESGASQFSILGYDLKKFPGRGILEAIGAGIKLKKEECALRCNFARIEGNKIVNLRVKIPSKKELNKINKIDKDIKVIPSVGYRGIVLVKNCKDIENTHPGYKRYKNFSMAINANMKLKYSGNKKFDLFLKEVIEILKDRTILVRGFGCSVSNVKKMKNWSLIADMPVEMGLGRLLGMKILKRKKDEIKQVIKVKGNVYVQIKGPDPYGHRGDLKGKIKAIEDVDKRLKPLTKLRNVKICVTSDHATPCKLKRHSKDVVPVLIYGGVRKDRVNKFSEEACRKGKIGMIYGNDLMKIF
jgi:2,3-bisphosphoglycerate-independent phosphoglycerate mutase